MGKKLSLGFALLIIAILMLTACQPAVRTESDCPKAEVFCVGMVTGLGGVNDKALNQTAWEGVRNAQTEKVVDWARYIETVDSKDYSTNITTFANAGYDLIVTNGSELGESTTNAAKKFPDILFLGINQDQGNILPNLVGLVFHEEQSGFLAGALAAQITKTNTIGTVLSTNTIPEMVAFMEGFEAGAKYINPNIVIISTYYSDGSELASTDPRWGAATAAQAIQKGADVITGVGGRTGNGALIETANHTGLYCIGFDIDQWETLTEAHPCLISSAMKLVTSGVFDLIKLAKDGTFPAGSYFGASGLAPYHDFESVIPQAVKDNLNQIMSGLNDGSITTSYNSSR
jgi:basic membrane protein A